MQNKMKVIETANIVFKDNIPYSLEFNETYFSNSGAIAEKTHVFLQANHLKKRFEALKNHDCFMIGEIGFGLAINFLLTFKLWHETKLKHQHLHYISTDLYPLSKQDLEKALAPYLELSPYAKQLLERYPTLTPGIHRLHFGNVSLTLLLGDAVKELKNLVCDFDHLLQKKIRPFSIDCWYFDGFSPQKNNQVWSEELLSTVKLLSNEKTTLTSYSVARTFKNALENCGFTYAKKKNIGNKREYLYATISDKKPIKTNSTQPKTTPWQCQPYSLPLKKTESIAIIGAGLAGCIMAHRLAERGFKVTLFEKESSIATQGSGNTLGMVHFNLSAFKSPLNDFMLSAYLYALRFYHSLKSVEYNEGIADLLTESNFIKKHEQLLEFSKNYPDLIQFINAKKLSHQANITLKNPALFWPKALTLSPKKLCQQLSSHENIELRTKQKINLESSAFDKIILCTGTSTENFSQCSYLPIETVSGMVSYFPQTIETKNLSIALNDNGYLTPVDNSGYHVAGGSYHIDNINLAHQEHLKCAIKISPIFNVWQTTTPQYKKGERAKTYDYLPYIGALAKQKEFKQVYSKIAKDKNIRINSPGAYYPHLYVLSGFGSHGLTTIPLAVEIVLCQLLNEPLPVSQTMLKSISPARCLIKELIKPTMKQL